MRVLILLGLCVSCFAKRPPKETSLRGGLQLARSQIVKALRGCNKLTADHSKILVKKKGARQLSTDQARRETIEMELQYDGRNFYAKASRIQGGDWAIVGPIVPDPCSDGILAVTEDDADAINALGLPWEASADPAIIGKTIQELGIVYQPTPRTVSPDAGAARRSLGPDMAGGVRLPESYDARDRREDEYPCQAFNVRNQGNCGTCSHFATASVFSARLCLQQGRTSLNNVLISPRQISDCAQTPSACAANGDGLSHRNMNWYANSGPRAKEEWCLPYVASAGNCSANPCPLGRTFHAKDVVFRYKPETVQAELLLNGPLSVSVMVSNSFFYYKKGVYVEPSTTTWYHGAGHSMMLVGWGVDNGIPYWLVQNSWGAYQGENGMVRIRRGTDEIRIESREIVTFTPIPSTECPVSRCANGSVTLADCTCKCTNLFMGGAQCDTLLVKCQNGGQMDRWNLSCKCPAMAAGVLCETMLNTTTEVSINQTPDSLTTERVKMNTRMSEADDARKQLRAQNTSTFTIDGAPFSSTWLITPLTKAIDRLMCLYVPAWLNDPDLTKQARLTLDENTYYPVFTETLQKLPATSQNTVCFIDRIRNQYPAVMFSLWIMDTRNTIDFNQQPFEIRFFNAYAASYRKNLATTDVIVNWAWEKGSPRPGESLRLGSVTGTNTATCALSLTKQGTCTFRLAKKSPTQAPYLLSILQPRGWTPVSNLLKPETWTGINL